MVAKPAARGRARSSRFGKVSGRLPKSRVAAWRGQRNRRPAADADTGLTVNSRPLAILTRFALDFFPGAGEGYLDERRDRVV